MDAKQSPHLAEILGAINSPKLNSEEERRGKQIAEAVRDSIVGLKLDALPLDILSRGIQESGNTLVELSCQLTAAVGIILSQAEDKEQAGVVVKQLLEFYEEMVSDIFNKLSDLSKDPAQLDEATLPSRIVFDVEKQMASGTPHMEAVEAAIAKFVSDPTKRVNTLHAYYKNKFSDQLLARSKELMDEGVPMEAATLQAIEEIVDHPAVKERLKERFHLLTLAKAAGFPPALAKILLNSKL